MKHSFYRLLCKSITFCLVPAAAKAQITADPSALANQRATVLQTANAIPQVNIQTPSSAGVSRNSFSQFDVQRNGAILNNARTATQTQMGGWVQGNPWLGTGSAKVILNEVNSSNPSQLNGYIEVAGPRAEVVIANPAGISVNGGGFINASKATLTTGTLNVNQGQIDNYRVQGGSIAIDGSGLDLRTTDYAAILARAVQVNAGIWANDLKVITGSNAIDAASLSANTRPLVTPIVGSSTAAEIALDVAQIGGMYAGKIFLLGTETGLGVRSAGVIGASDGNLVLQNNGPLTNSGTMQAKGDLQITTQANMTNSGTLYATGLQSINTAGNLQNNGSIVSEGDTLISANGLNSSQSSSISTQGNLDIRLQSDFSPQGKLQASKNLNLSTSGVFNNQSDLTTPGKLFIAATDVNNSGALGSGTLIHLQANHSIVNSGKIIGPSVLINAGTQIRNTGPSALIGATDAAGNLTLLAPTIENTDDIATTDSTPSTTILGIGAVTLAGGMDANKNITQANTIINRSALIESGGHMLISANALTNTRRALVMGSSFDQAISPSELNALGVTLSGSTGQINVHDPNSIGGVYIEPPHGGSMNSDYIRTDFTGSGFRNSVISTSPQAQIVSDGNLRTNVNTLQNYWAQVSAAGNIDLSGATLDQDSWRGSAMPQYKVAYAGSYIYRTYKGNMWSHSFCDSGCDAPGDNKYFTSNRYESSLTSNANIVGSGVSLNNGGAGVGSWVSPLQNLTNPAPIVVSNSGLFKVATEPNSNYLITTDPLFTSYQQWMSSDFMLQNLSLDPSMTQKRLGDGFYEQRLIREQISNLTGKPFLSTYSDSQKQYADLMANSVTLAKSTQLTLGIALTAEQMSQLTSDIVWLVQQDVTLPDGTASHALMPQVYLAHTNLANKRLNGALVSGNSIQLTDIQNFKNSGTLQANQDLELQANGDLDNAFGVLQSGRNMLLAAKKDIDLSSAKLQALQLDIQAGGNIALATTTYTSPQQNTKGPGLQTQLGPVASISVGQDARIGADGNLTIAGANVEIGGNFQAKSGANIKIGAVQTEDQKSLERFGGVGSTDVKVQHGSTISVGKNTSITSGKDLSIEGSQLTLGSTNSNQANITAGGSLSVTATKDASDILSTNSESTWHGANTSLIATHTESVKGSHLVSLGDLNLISGKDIAIDGSEVVANRNIQIDAKGDLRIASVAQTQEQDSTFTNSKSNVLMQSDRRDETRISSSVAKGSTVTSLAGNATLQAGNSFFQIGSDVIAPNSDVSITAQNVAIQEARETLTNQQSNSYSESGVTANITNPVVSAIQSAEKLDNARHQTNDSRMTGMAIASAALTASQAIDAYKTSPETIGGVSLNTGIGKTSASNTSTYQSDTSKVSSIMAGGDIHIAASGATDSGNITIQGGQIEAKGNTLLKADNTISLQASQSSTTFDQTTNFSTSNAGVAINSNSSIGATTGFSSGQGQTHATDQTFMNTHVKGQTVSIQSGGDTSLQGAVISANQISANIGGNLAITSKQDSSTYQSNEQSRGMSIVAPIGAGAYGGSTSSSKTNIVSEYVNVTEQSAIRAGDGGFTVNVTGNTTLKGGAITSSQNAIDTKSNSFTTNGTINLVNVDSNAHFQANSMAISAGMAGAGEVTQPLNSIGIGSKAGNANDTTLATISGVAGNVSARTGDAPTGISKIFDASSVKADVQSQVAISAEFGKQASKAIGDYADIKLRDAITLGDQSSVDNWKEGGAARLSLHALVGGLTGNLSGAAGAVASQSFVPIVGNALNAVDIPIEVKQAIVLAAGTAVGSAVGGTSGAASSYNVTSNNYLTHAEDMQRNALRKAKNTNNCDKTCEEDLTLLDAIDESRDSEIQNVISLCRKVRIANNCLAVARHYADVNGYGFASAKYESVGRTGSPFSFNGYLVNKGTEDEHYEVPQIKLPNGTTKPDPGGFSYGMFQLSANRGGMEEFLNYLINPYSSKEAKGFYIELTEVGGLEAARNGDKQFVNKFMELTQRDPQFIEYQFESINQKALKKHIVEGLRDLSYEFNDLEPMEKEALFSVVVQNGGLGAYRAASYVLHGSYFQKKMEYMSAMRDGKKLAESGDALLNMKIDLLLSKDKASPQKLQNIESEISILDQKINVQKEKINANANYAEGLRDWSKVSGPIGPLDDEMFINALYDWRIKSRPTEAASRYIPERDMLLKMLRDKNEQQAKHPK